VLPVARVAVDVSLAHLDRPFDYQVPERLSAQAVPGCRVRVRFAGRLTNGYVLERADTTEHQGKLAFLDRVISPEPVLTAEIAGLARAVADRYAGTMADVLRLAIPPRHARAEASSRNPDPENPDPENPDPENLAGPTAPAEPGQRASNTPSTDQPTSDDAHGGSAPPESPGPTTITSPGAPQARADSGEGPVRGGAPAPGEALAGCQSAPGDPAAEPGTESSGGAVPPGGHDRDGSVRPGPHQSATIMKPDAPQARAGSDEGAGRGDAAAPSDVLAGSRDIPADPVAEPGAGVPAQLGDPGAAGAAPRPGRPDAGTWGRYRTGPSFLDAVSEGRAPRAVWSALPGPAWPEEIARAAATAAAAGRGALIVVPDARDLDQADAALTALLGPGEHVCLAAGLGPAERYRRWLKILRGEVAIVAGTRAAMFAPVARLGLVVLWDDGDDLHDELRAPYPHAREVLALRAYRCGAAALIGGFARTAAATQLVASGWAHALAADRAVVRERAPKLSPAGEDGELARDQAAQSARLPSLALRTARAALSHGPVLIQVPRRGYVVAAACARCRAPARCATCAGPLRLNAAGAAPVCAWCGTTAPWACPHCGGTQLRAAVTGARRTAEELGRAFPSVPVRTSGGDSVLAEVPDSPAVVVATPGAEPRAEGGYAAALLLDGWVLLSRPSLGAAEEALRRWLNAAALVRPAAAGGAVIVVAGSAHPAVQALIRWDPVTHAERELAERAELRFPPAVRMASLTGSAQAVGALIEAARLPPQADLLGPVPIQLSGLTEAGQAEQTDVRALARVPRPAGGALATALQAAQAIRSAKKEPGVVRVRLDPAELI
jgi:primosomal protein N' (replication factor Y)